MSGKESLNEENNTQNIPAVYLLPRLQPKGTADIPFLVLADGNNRAALENKTYDDGGQNVISIAQSVARSGQSTLMAACILGPDNLRKRPASFKNKVAMAFDMLGRRIHSRGLLVDDGIRMETYGNLEEASHLTPADGHLMDIIQEICRKTERVTAPKMRLILGVNYDAEMAKNLGIKMIFRSGLETPENFRTSGIRVHPGIRNYGVTTLWPDVQSEQILEAIDRTRELLGDQLAEGYSDAEIAEIVSQPDLRTVGKGKLVIPYSDVAARPIDQLISGYLGSPHINALNVIDAGGSVTSKLREGQGTEISLIDTRKVRHAEWVFRDVRALVAPGQSVNGLVVPEFPHLDYTNVHVCKDTPEGIVDGVRRSLELINHIPQNLGAERELDTTELPEFSRYKLLAARITPENNLEDACNTLLRTHGRLDMPMDKYDMVADLFGAKMLNWSKKIGLKWANTNQLRAFMNYSFTSAFLCYCPNHPDWQTKLREGWENRADIVGRYMVLTSLMDDTVFDEVTEEIVRARILSKVPAALIAAVTLEGDNVNMSFDFSDLPNQDKIGIIVGEFRKLAQDLKAQSNAEYFQRWQEGVRDLILCMGAEWQTDIGDKAIFKEGVDQGKTEAMIHDRYLSDPYVPDLIKEKLQIGLQGFKSENEQERQNAATDMNLLIYLVDIEKSIGAGLTYKTLVCPGTKGEDAKEGIITDLEKISALMNIYFRLANDWSEFFREEGDKDWNFSSCDIVRRRFASDDEGERQSRDFLMALIKELRTGMYHEMDRFQATYGGPNEAALAIAMQRSRIGELFYLENTHYRSAKRAKVSEFFRKLQNCGIGGTR